MFPLPQPGRSADPGPQPRRAVFGAIAALGVVVLSSAACAPARVQATDRLHVLLVIADDLGWGEVGYHGAPIETPHIDLLAREGVALERFYTSPICTPTRAAILTGLSPMRLGLQYAAIRPWSSAGLPDGLPTIADRFRDAGYATALVGKWHLGHSRASQLPRARGFDHFYGHLTGGVDYYRHTRLGARDWQRNGRSLAESGYTSDLLADEAVRMLQERDRARPLFLVLAFNAPHVPRQAPEALVRHYAELGPPPRPTNAASVHALDRALGRVLDAMDLEGLRERTLVVFLSDNGAALEIAGNAPLRGGKGEVSEGGIRVPAVMRLPGVLPAGVRSRQRVRDLDLLPTLAAAAGVRLEDGAALDGRNAWPVLTSGGSWTRDPFLFAVEGQEGRLFAAVGDRWKLVVEVGRGGEPPTAALFDLGRDPGETQDVAKSHPQVVERLQLRLREWRALHPRDGIRRQPSPTRGWRPPRDWSELEEVPGPF